MATRDKVLTFAKGGRLDVEDLTSTQPKGKEGVAQPKTALSTSSPQPMAATVAAQPLLRSAVTTVAAQPSKSTAGPVRAVAIEPGIISAVRPDILSTLRPDIIRIRPDLISIPVSKTTTQLAQGAIKQLKEVEPTALREALNAIQSKNIVAAGLMNYLERKVKIGEVLNKFAKDWADDTKQDFTEAFPMEAGKFAVMDSIVSIAILNDPDLEEELRIENTPETTEADLLENRRIVWQYPPPGTILEPPYLVLVAVEHQDIARAEEVIQSILGELIVHQGYKIPKSAAQKLR